MKPTHGGARSRAGRPVTTGSRGTPVVSFRLGKNHHGELSKLATERGSSPGETAKAITVALFDSEPQRIPSGPFVPMRAVLEIVRTMTAADLEMLRTVATRIDCTFGNDCKDNCEGHRLAVRLRRLAERFAS